MSYQPGDLVRDKLNTGDSNYGLGVIVRRVPTPRPLVAPRKYEVYFTKFERTITFHGDYLERV